jgi:hypothetical protein
MLTLLKTSLHLQTLALYHGHNGSSYCTVFTYLGHHVSQGGQGKYNTCRCHRRFRGCYSVTFANVNDPAWHAYSTRLKPSRNAKMSANVCNGGQWSPELHPRFRPQVSGSTSRIRWGRTSGPML